MEVAYIKRWLEEDRAAQDAVAAKAGKAEKGRGKARDESSSHGKGETQASKEAVREEHARGEPAGNGPSGIEALYVAA